MWMAEPIAWNVADVGGGRSGLGTIGSWLEERPSTDLCVMRILRVDEPELWLARWRLRNATSASRTCWNVGLMAGARAREDKFQRTERALGKELPCLGLRHGCGNE